jgi:uroporphyrinogen-III decarboxylase
MDLPKGKTIWLFDQTDMAKAKKTIGQVACIQGNVPLSLMHAGAPDEVEAYVRELIEVAAEGGGYILDVGAVADSGKDENLRTMVETARKYGRY